ncbi:MAG TPA: dephospho-CoA kinase [Jiangellaceae bacterium]|jgi:dephospho-CoA kinase|nr:dephospho-CoA kinase [Jiangellaceae bacterium]
MLRVGLTGGIGSGKSTVARRLVARGAVLIDADVIAREVVGPGTIGLQAVLGEFGADLLAADGSLDRAALAQVVFADTSRRQTLNSIVHPLVAARRSQLVGAAAPDAIVVEDIPLLVENDLGAAFHLVVVVSAPAEQRVSRLVAERRMTADDVWARVRAQVDDHARRAAADVWLDNSGPPDELLTAVNVLWDRRLVPFERNVRSRTIVWGPERPTLVAHDPTWRDQAQRLCARVASAVDPDGLGVQHTGSTAIPGIRAKDVVDLQLAVRSLADADTIGPALEDAGFPRAPGHWKDDPKPLGPDPAHWQKRFHGSADPARPVHLHIREHGSPGWRYALLFRDWLRAEPAEAAAYEAEKMRLASMHETTSAYAEAKEPWFDAALPRVEAWAARTHWSIDPAAHGNILP